MPGKLISVLPRRRFEYAALGGSAIETIVLAPAICASAYNYAGIYVRVHARDMTAGQSLNFHLYNTLPSDDDPREFVEVDGAGAPNPLVTVSITSTSPGAVPSISLDYTTRAGPILKLELEAVQASTPSTFYAELSAELLLRETG